MNTKAESRLLVQLNKEQFRLNIPKPNQKRLEDLYHTISKLEPNNLKLVEFIMICLDKGLFTNAHGLKVFSQIFDDFGMKTIESDTALTLSKNNAPNTQDQERKFHKQKFVKLWPQLARKINPGDETAYERIFFPKLVSNEVEQYRFRLDDPMKKLLTKENVKYLLTYQQSLQKIFTIYIPQNFNMRLGFQWNQLRLLNKRLPVACCLRFLTDAQICPNLLANSAFSDILSKCIPPLNSTHKQKPLSSSELTSKPLRNTLRTNPVKPDQGDFGLSFHQFQLMMMKISIQISKQQATKGDLYAPLKKLFIQLIGVPSSVQKLEQENSNSEFRRCWRQYDVEIEREKLYRQRSVSNSSIIYEDKSQGWTVEDSDAQDSTSNFKDMDSLKRMIEDQTSPVPQSILKLKENNGVYNMDEKCIVIGQQPPKIVEKVRLAPKPNKKDVDQLLGQKPEVPRTTVESNSHFVSMLNPSGKQLKNNTFYPILLSQAFSPPNMDPEAELYVETAFISLSEHNYNSAKQNLKKSKRLQKTPSVQNELFFLYVEGQISQTMGQDNLALDYYSKCLDMITRTKQTIPQGMKALPYSGIGGCLYHSEQHQHALRCFLKAKELQQGVLFTQSEQMAEMLNNIGCCYLKLQRATQAKKHFQQSYRILDSLLGVYHQRTLIVLHNLNKSKKCYVPRVPKFKSMWRTFSRKPGAPTTKKR